MINSNKLNSNISNILLGALCGIGASYLFSKLRKYISTKNNITRKEDSYEGEITKITETDDEIILIREQLKRNYEFFGNDGMKLIEKSFVCVVGIGGVGSHVIMTLIRSGVSKIRVIDYDIVTLSSLNRHAFAMRADVGKLKVRVVKEYANKINPNIIVETIDDAFISEFAEKYLLKGNPDYIIDCIDDLEAKCELIKFCHNNKLNLISSMGAGAKSDPTSIRVSDFHFVQGDTLAKRLRYIYKKNFSVAIPNFKTIYSIEKSSKKLTELEEHQKDNPEIYRINENERVRSLPVFASIPAIFGQAIAAVVLTDLGKQPINFGNNKESTAVSEVLIGNVSLKKLYEDYKQNEAKRERNTNNPVTNIEINDENELIYENFLKIAEAFKKTSSISLKLGNKMKFIKWDASKTSSIDNIILLSKSESNKHFELRNSDDLLKFYGEATYYRVCSILKKLKSENN